LSRRSRNCNSRQKPKPDGQLGRIETTSYVISAVYFLIRRRTITEMLVTLMGAYTLDTPSIELPMRSFSCVRKFEKRKMPIKRWIVRQLCPRLKRTVRGRLVDDVPAREVETRRK